MPDVRVLLERHRPRLVYDSHEVYFADSAAIWTDSRTKVPPHPPPPHPAPPPPPPSTAPAALAPRGPRSSCVPCSVRTTATRRPPRSATRPATTPPTRRHSTRR